MSRIFPGAEWAEREPAAMGFSPQRLAAVGAWLDQEAGDQPYRVAIARGGALVAEFAKGIERDAKIRLRSASKSAYTLLLGIAIEEGRLAGLDDKVTDYYPELIDVGPDDGPKPGRHAYPANAGIRFRHLAGNTSGYLKPDEPPGERFHYQTFGMNVISNAMAKIYGLYDSSDPDRLPGCAALVAEKLRDPIGGSWDHAYYDFDFKPGMAAKRGVYGHGLQLVADARDCCRIGHLWLSKGSWNGRQVVPAWYLAEATRTNADILANEAPENFKYGLGFWTNDHGRLWADLPRDIHGAWGGGAKYIWVSPALDLVMVMCPGPWDDLMDEAPRRPKERAFIKTVLDALER
jgi:CubicO group peptidase (beta-lactamase class C family)